MPPIGYTGLRSRLPSNSLARWLNAISCATEGSTKMMWTIRRCCSRSTYEWSICNELNVRHDSEWVHAKNRRI